MRVALVSLDQKWEDKAENLQRCRIAARRAAARGADLIVFPEMTLTAFTMQAASAAEDPDDSPTIRAFAALAREVRALLAFGVVLHGETRPTNNLVLLERDGSELARYAKVHPFSHADEHRHYEGGTELVTATADGVRLGLTVCYDLRFPELYTSLAERCDAILVIANWPAPRITHWHTLLAARAIDGQCYIIGVNRTGTDGNGIAYPLSSCVIDPRGDRVAADDTSDDIELCTIEPAVVHAHRQHFPTLRDRRPDLYRAFAAQPAPAPFA